jgi:multicomponent Na+:H+ antiporter subunit D
MNPSTAIQMLLLIPLFAIVLTVLFDRRPNVRELFTLAAGILLLWVAGSLAPQVFDGGRPTWSLPFEMVSGLPIAFRAEPLGMLFALVASTLWIATSCYSIGYMRGHHEKHQTRFYVCFALAIFAAMGAAMAENMFTLFIFYEVLTLSTYPLVTHHGTEKARRGGRTYLSILLFTSVSMLLLAMAWTWNLAGTLDFTAGGILSAERLRPGKELTTLGLGALLALYVFGTGKAAVMPFHRWLPAAMVAPTPVSALLHAVAVVKVGVFTVMKVVVYIFGTDLLTSTGVSTWLMYVAGMTILLGSLVALTKDNLKARLAYSTISQLSYIVLGAMLANSYGVIGGSMHIAMHACGKITLFFCAGAIYVAAHKTEISDMRGIGRVMPVTLFAFLLGSISVIGLPPFGGSWSKWYLALGTAEAGQLPLMAILMISSLLNIAYLMPIVVRGYFFAPVDGPEKSEIKEAPLMCVIPLCCTAVGGVALFFFADTIYQWLLPITTLQP